MGETSNSNEPHVKGSSRLNDKGLGIPAFEPEQARTLSEAETARHQQELEAELRREFTRKLSEMDSDKDIFRLPKSLQKGALTLLLVIVGVLGLFVVVEAVNFAGQVGRLTAPFNYIAIFFAAVFGLMLIFVILRLIGLFFKLKRTNSVNLKALEILAERQRWQTLAEEHAKAAKERFIEYLKDYELSAGKRETQFVALGFSREDFAGLSCAKEQLLAAAATMPARAWLNEFKTAFQDVLDDYALKRSRQYALRATIGTAISPIKFIDQVVVLYAGIAMVKDMCVIYNLRPGFGQTLVILSRSIVNAYLSGVINEGVDQAADSISEWLGEISGLLGSGMGRFIGARASEGALNGFLLWRLGKRMVTMLRLVRVKV